MATFTLYGAPGACSLASHIALREAGADFALTKVSLPTHTTEDGRDFYAINPKGYVPALELEDGEILTENPAVLQYIADTHPYANLAPTPGTVARARVQEDLNYLSAEIHKAFGPLFRSDTPEEAKRKARDQIGKRFDELEKRLAGGRDYLQGDFTVADPYFFVMTRFATKMGMDLARWPHIAAFKTRMEQRPHVQAALEAEGQS